jgi:hypothetical protein
MNKTVRIGTINTGRGRWASIFAKIEYIGGKLSITGVEGPLPSGNALGGAGQIIMSFKEYDARGYMSIRDIKPAPGWDRGKIKRFFDLWDRWHLNDMRAGCEHQRALGWDKEPIDPNKPTTAYGKFYPGQTHDSRNLKSWVNPPVGHMSEPCPVCGYKYGTAWLTESVPADVINFLFGLPDADITPAWV